MKRKSTRSILIACIALCMTMQTSVSSAAATGDDDDKKEKKEVKKAKAKVSSSRNNSSVKIYPDILKRVMHVVAKDNGVDFFVFDLEGTIVKHYKMKSGEHEKITDLERGKYVFSVFSGDEETANGNFEIR
jgi:hypothetical protein